jgi:hypothetical protein
VYRYVIDDVINQVRGEFEDMGIDEAVLQELQRVSRPTETSDPLKLTTFFFYIC